jgi:hypothetical protein
MDWRNLSDNIWKKIKGEGKADWEIIKTMGQVGKEIGKRIWNPNYAAEQSLKGLRAAKKQK